MCPTIRTARHMHVKTFFCRTAPPVTLQMPMLTVNQLHHPQEENMILDKQ